MRVICYKYFVTAIDIDSGSQACEGVDDDCFPLLLVFFFLPSSLNLNYKVDVWFLK